MSTIQRDLDHRPLDLQDSLLEQERLKKLDAEICEDITEVVSQRAWFDSNGCSESYHGFRRVNGRMEAFHSDDQVCGVSEYFLPLSF